MIRRQPICTRTDTPVPYTRRFRPHIHTSEQEQPQAEWMAWNESVRLLAVGDAKTLQAQAPDAERSDAGEATVIPGLIDAHGHVMGLGYALMQADLVGARDKAEVVARLRKYEKTLPEGAWLLGNGWDQNDWPDKSFPTAADLDAAFPEQIGRAPRREKG